MTKWKGKPLIPAALAEPVKWALGCYSGARLRPFRQADLPGGQEAAAAALQLLWKAGVVTRAATPSPQPPTPPPQPTTMTTAAHRAQ